LMTQTSCLDVKASCIKLLNVLLSHPINVKSTFSFKASISLGQ